MDLKTSIVAVLNSQGKIIGTGFVAGENLILTCAHVIEQATAGLNERVTIRFSNNSKAEAKVDQESFSPSYEKDVALLRVDSLPQDITPLQLGNAASSAGYDFYTYGYATVTDVQGIGARGKIVDIVNSGRLVQLTSQEPDHGMSGGPVLDEQRRVVIGMVTKGKGLLEKDQNLRNTQTTFATSVEVIREICPNLVIAGILQDNDLRDLRNNFIELSLKHNEYFSIPNLNIRLPISNVLAQLRAIDSSRKDNNLLDPPNLEKQIREYREWYESTHSQYDRDSFDVEKIAYQNSRLVIIAGAGAGKSTLLRRLAWNLLGDGHLVVRISLKTIALRLRKGESFDEALTATAGDGFSVRDDRFADIISNCEYLLADGLDETGESSIKVGEYLKLWGLARPNLKVFVTTRPVGYNPSWLPGWANYELLPLSQESVNNYVPKLFELRYGNNESAKRATAFLEELKKSKIAKIAARNPQLLGFLLALFINERGLSGNRFQLFEKIIDDIRNQIRLDREFSIISDKSIANYVIEHLGFLLLDKPDATENHIEQAIGKSLEQQLGITHLVAIQKVIDALRFWEERGLIERLTIGSFTAFVFIHAAFQEFLAARYLAQFSDADLIKWVLENYKVPNSRETLLLLGSTNKRDLVVETLLNTRDINDPVLTTHLLIVGVLAETENIIPSLPEKVFKLILARLTSNLPSAVDETISVLLPLAEISSDVIGPIALKLSTHQEMWVVEAACVLGLITGEAYVNTDALLSVYLKSSEYSSIASRSGFGFKLRDHMRILVIEGGKYLVKHDLPRFKETILERYDKNYDYSLGTLLEFESILRNVFSPEEFSKLKRRELVFNIPNINNMDDRHRAEWQFILTTLLTALQDYSDKRLPSPDKYLGSLSRFYSVLDIGETPATDMPILLKIGMSDEMIEVIRGAIIVSGINPLQLRADSIKALSLLNDHSIRSFEIINESLLGAKNVNSEINWALLRDYQLNLNLLLRAVVHQVWFVCRFAALLLLEYATEIEVKSGLKKIVKGASHRTLKLIALIAPDIWADEAGLVVLERLESDFTDDCSPLIELLGSIASPPLISRTLVVLRKSLEYREVDIVEAALPAIEKLGLFNELQADIKNAYEWWIKEGPQYPEKSGVVPPNAAKALLVFLNLHDHLDLVEVKNAVNSRRLDVRDAAIKILVERCIIDENLFMTSLREIEHGGLPIKILDELKKEHPSFCVSHLDDFLRILNSKNLQVKISAIKILGISGMKSATVEQRLRSFLESDQVEVREIALRSLRNIDAK